MKPIKSGLIAGVIMSLILAFLSIQGAYGASPLKYLKYIALIAVLIWYYKDLIKSDYVGGFFGNYLVGGAKISAIGGAIVGLVNAGLFVINNDYAIQKFNLTASTASEMFMISLVLFVEIFVLGMLSSFIVFPIFKNMLKSRPNSPITSDL